MHTQIGFDLRNAKHYGSAETAIAQVQKTLKPMIDAGVVFNVTVVEQTHEGQRRFVPLLNCFRAPESSPGAVAYALIAARKGFICFA